MRDIESILLTYENKNRLEFQYCAEFFRLLGVYVCENLRDITDGSEEIHCDKRIFTYCYDIEEKADNEELVDYLVSVLETVVGVGYLPDWLRQVVSLYDSMKIMQSSVVLQYYYKTQQEQRILEAGIRFRRLADELFSIENTHQECVNDRHFLYAKLYCKQKANFAKYYYDKSYGYYIDEIVEEGVDIIRKFPEFSNVWVLLGLIYEASDKYIRESEDAFLQGISMIGDMPYVASVYYWLGRLYERNDFPMSAEESYRKANSVMVRYRNEYKVAVSDYNCKKWEKSLEHFDNCLRLLERKGTYFDPLELEYYFKICIQMSKVYLKLEDYRNAIIRALSALRLRDNVIKDRNEYTEFYVDLFQQDAKPYIDLTIKKMKPKTAYQYLAEACEEIGLTEDAERYWELYRVWI